MQQNFEAAALDGVRDRHMMTESTDEYLQPHDTTPSFWADMTRAAPDPVFGLIHGFLDDQNENKVLLGVGAYRDDDGKPVVDHWYGTTEPLSRVQADEELIFYDPVNFTELGGSAFIRCSPVQD